jgi:hypothetical protein
MKNLKESLRNRRLVKRSFKYKTVALICLLVASVCWHMPVSAQVSVRFNIGTQPVWGPSGYDYADYYYLPDADAYYDINRRVFVYREGRTWMTRSSLPGRYGNIDLYRTHKIVINDRDPWMHHDRDHNRYMSFRNRHDQEAIRDARDQKYWQNPGHPQYGNWKREHDNHEQRNNDHNQNDNQGHGNYNEGHGHDNSNHGNGHDNGNHGNGHGRGH